MHQEMFAGIARWLEIQKNNQLRSETTEQGQGALPQGEDSQFTLSQDEFQKIRKIVLIISGCLFGLLILVIIGRCLRNHRICRIFNCWRLNGKYKKFKQNRNNPDPGDKTEEQFDKQVSRIILLMNRSHQQNNFTFLKSGLQHATRLQVSAKKLRSFVYEINIQGTDFEGSYEGKGAIVAKKKYPLIWFFKTYDDRKKAQQQGDFKYLVFESFYMSRKGIGGKWFHIGLESSQMNSGKWKIIDSQRVEIINTQKHLLEEHRQQITEINSPVKRSKKPR